MYDRGRIGDPRGARGLATRAAAIRNSAPSLPKSRITVNAVSARLELSGWEQRFAERLLTVVATCRQQGRHLLDFLAAAGEAALRRSLPPSLLPAPCWG